MIVARLTRPLTQAVLTSLTHSKTRPRVTTPASFKIQVTAERAPPIVTGGAGVVAGGKVLLRARRADLSLLRQATRIAVTIGTVQALARGMIGVTKRVAEGD